MRRARWSLGIAVLLWVVTATGAADSPPKVELKVLYASAIDTPRSREFMALLEGAFTRVGTVETANFTPEMARWFDVVVIDAPDAEKGSRGITAANLTTAFDRPVVLVGAGGGRVLRALKLKLDYG